MSEPVDLRDEIKALCDKLGHPYDCVGRIDIHPGHVEAVVYERNGHGNLFSRDGYVAERTITTAIRS